MNLYNTGKKFLATIIFILSVTSVYAQAEKFTVASDSFFTRQTDFYKNWLLTNGLDKVININKVITDTSNNTVSLRLFIGFTTPDSAFSAYQKLDSEILRTSNISVNEILFWKMVHLFNVKPQQAILEISDKKDIREATVYYQTKLIKDSVVTLFSKFKDISSHQPVKVNVNADQLNNEIKECTLIIDAVPGKTIAWYNDFIRTQMKSYFKEKIPAEKFEDNSMPSVMDFSVYDVQNEVFQAQSKRGLYEKLDYSIKVKLSDKSLTITFIDLGAAYASGISGGPPEDKTIGGGYQEMFRFPTYKVQLDNYKQTRFPAKVYSWFRNIK